MLARSVPGLKTRWNGAARAGSTEPRLCSYRAAPQHIVSFLQRRTLAAPLSQHRPGRLAQLRRASEPAADQYADDDDEFEEYGEEFEGEEEVDAEQDFADDRQLVDDATSFNTIDDAAAGGEGDEFEEYEEEGEEGAAAYDEPPGRAYYLPDLMAKAAYLPYAALLDKDYRDLAVYGLQNDAALVVPGDLYFCYPSQDMQEGAQLALARGAVAIIAEREVEAPEEVPVVLVDDLVDVQQRVALAFYDAPSRDLRVVGVTGSSGKTTVSWLVRGLLEEMQQLTGMVGNIEYALAEDRLTEEGEFWEADEEDVTLERECSTPFFVTPYQGKYGKRDTTPDSLRMQKLLSSMRDRGASAAVLECSPEAIEQGHLDWVELDVAVFTNFSSETAELLCGPNSTLNGPEGVLAAYAELFHQLMGGKEQRAVFNKDDPSLDILAEALGDEVPVVTYALDNETADVFPLDVKYSIWETELLVRTPLGKLQIITPLLGKHNVYNVLAAVATGIAMNVPLQAIVAGIEAVEVIPGRSEIIDEGQPFSVVVDAGGSPEHVAAMLDSFRLAGARRIFTVMGSKGLSDKGLRPRLGEVLHTRSDFVILTNDNPHREDPGEIVQDIVAGFPDEIINKHSAYVYFPFQDQGRVPLWFEPYLQKAQMEAKRYVMEDRYSAIRAAIGTAQAGDVVYLAGKGDEDYQEYADDVATGTGTIKGWFDDRVEARNALSRLRYLEGLPHMQRETLPWGDPFSETTAVFV